MTKTIAISLSPNATATDIRIALGQLLMPWRWRDGPLPDQVEEWFKTYLPVAHAVTFDSGRSAMLGILRALGIGEGDEVLLQAYTCVAVPNSVLWNGARPCYVDIAPTGFNMDTDDLARKVSPRTKAILVQHTFGHPAPLKEILAVARRHGLVVIEDCAHALGATYDGQPVGTFGDAAFFSFGRDKAVSSVFGGIAVTNDAALGARMREIRDAHRFPPRRWVAQQLLHPIAFGAIVPLYYRWGLGKALLVALQRLRLLSRAVEPEERRGGQPSVHPSRFPNALAALALRQLTQLDRLNAHRRAISRVYDAAFAGTPIAPPGTDDGGAIYLRYTIQVPDPARIHQAARARRMMLGDWYDVPIAPKGTDLEAVGYTPGACPRAERVAHHSINLPTHRKVTEADAREIAKLVMNEVGARMGLEFREVVSKEQWEEFLLAQEGHSFLQSWNWGVFSESIGERVTHLGAFEGDTLVGGALLTRTVARRGSFLACPGGPVMDWERQDLVAAMMRQLKTVARHQHVWFVRVRPFLKESPEAYQLFRSYGWRDAPIHMHAETTLELDIARPEDEVLGQMRKNRRYEIRRAGRDGVTITQSRSVEDVEILYNLQMETVARHQFTPFSLSYMRKEFAAFVADDQAILFLAHYEGQCVAAALIIYYGASAAYHYGASASAFDKTFASALIQWEAIQEAKRRGCRIYNFWGIAKDDRPDHPWAGLTGFKRGFGGERVDYVHAQDLGVSPRYWLTYAIEEVRRRRRRL